MSFPYIDTFCFFDSWVNGVRVTFAWDHYLNSTLTLNWLEDLANRTVGLPDVVLVNSGPWEVRRHIPWNASRIHAYFERMDTIFHNAGEDLRGVWPNAWRRPPWKIW